MLDAPEHLQLHAALDLFSSLPYSVVSQVNSLASSVFWVDRSTVEKVIIKLLEDRNQADDARYRRIREVKTEGWDLFLRILADGSVVVTAVAVRIFFASWSYIPSSKIQNIDRRPPTLLQQFTLQQSQPSLFSSPPSYLYLLPNPDLNLLTLVTSPPLMSLDLHPASFFDAQSNGLRINFKGSEYNPAEEAEIVRFIRTPEGKGVGALRVGGGGDAWKIVEGGTKLIRCGEWERADFVVVLANGKQPLSRLR